MKSYMLKLPTLFFYTKCSEPNLKYYYNIKNYKFENINYKSLLLEYNKYYNKELALDFFEDLTYNKNNKEDFHFKNIPLNINVNSINNNYLPLYNPLLSIGIVHSFFKNYTINFNCKTACQNKNIINTGNIGIRDFNNIQNTNKKSTRISSFIKKINNQIYQENKYNNLNSNINSTSKSKEYYSIFYRRNLKYLFRNYPISDIYLILQEEIQSCIYCCCTDNINSQKFNNRFLNSDSIPCSTFYNILRNQLEDIIIKLYLELILEENSENSEIFSIFKSVTTYKNQRELYINYIFFFDNITDSNYKTPKMSDKQYTNEYAVKVADNIDAKELADKLGLNFGGQIGELEGYYLFKVNTNNNDNDDNIYRNIESNLSNEKNIEWFERQYLKSFQKRRC
ncbi:hypothetical protein H8356DRAFT_1270996 [Neocallimastix lanati (nom. inval.)]|uniref:Peptidase S8 pro-domain domain-containing protein n=1 Tax=Neocallimastix californiae TaxID=1754190 RepID=A0A1Y2EPQ1_9FUNG|nr:hypothetical protein H8356DRAFT_1270996 [Neocallimastix sp. JGI-2020a]ORY73498.1 hypothetical protein LY90DRAFT_666590 [Neocallimastix californiae]|eukprot:ORY73498.1 hypothetical protein LY90DRAFT_666590 [Neocallimastix californiae]